MIEGGGEKTERHHGARRRLRNAHGRKYVCLHVDIAIDLLP